MCCIITVQNSVTAKNSLLSPTGGVNTIPPNTEKGLRKLHMKTMAAVKSYVHEVNENYSITIKKSCNDAHINKPLTIHNKYTNDDVDLDDCVAYKH